MLNIDAAFGKRSNRPPLLDLTNHVKPTAEPLARSPPLPLQRSSRQKKRLYSPTRADISSRSGGSTPDRFSNVNASTPLDNRNNPDRNFPHDAPRLMTESIHSKPPVMPPEEDYILSKSVSAEPHKKKKKSWIKRLWRKSPPHDDIFLMAQRQRASGSIDIRTDSPSTASFPNTPPLSDRVIIPPPLQASQANNGSYLLTSPASTISNTSSHRSSLHSSISSLKNHVKAKYEDHKARKEARKELSRRMSLSNASVLSASAESVNLFKELPQIDVAALAGPERKKKKSSWNITKMFKKNKDHHSRAVSFASGSHRESVNTDNASVTMSQFEPPPSVDIGDTATSTATTEGPKKKKFLGGLLGSTKRSKSKLPPEGQPQRKCLTEEELLEEEKRRLDRLRDRSKEQFLEVVRELTQKLCIEHSQHYAWKHRQLRALLERSHIEKAALEDRCREYLEKRSNMADEKAKALSAGRWELVDGLNDVEVAQIAAALLKAEEVIHSVFSKTNDKNEMMSMELQADQWLSNEWLTEHKTLNSEVYRTVGVLRQNHALVSHFDQLVEATVRTHQKGHYATINKLSTDIDRLHNHIILIINSAFDSFKLQLLEYGGSGQPGTDISALLAPQCIVKSIHIALEEAQRQPIPVDAIGDAGEDKFIQNLLDRSLKRKRLPVGEGLIMNTSEYEWKMVEQKLEGRWGHTLVLQKWMAAAAEWQLMDVACQYQLHQDKIRLEQFIQTKKHYMAQVVEKKLAQFWAARSNAAQELAIDGLTTALENAISTQEIVSISHDQIDSEREVMAYEDERMRILPHLALLGKKEIAHLIPAPGLTDISQVDKIIATLTQMRRVLEENHALVNDMMVQKYIEETYKEIRSKESLLKELQSSTLAKKTSLGKKHEEALAKKQKLIDLIAQEEAKVESAKQVNQETEALHAEIEELKTKLDNVKKRNKDIQKRSSSGHKKDSGLAGWFGSSKANGRVSFSEDPPDTSLEAYLSKSRSDPEPQPKSPPPTQIDKSSPQEVLAAKQAADLSYEEILKSPSVSHALSEEESNRDWTTETDLVKKKKKTIWRKIVGGGSSNKRKHEDVPRQSQAPIMLAAENKSEATDTTSVAEKQEASSNADKHKKQGWGTWFGNKSHHSSDALSDPGNLAAIAQAKRTEEVEILSPTIRSPTKFVGRIFAQPTSNLVSAHSEELLPPESPTFPSMQGEDESVSAPAGSEPCNYSPGNVELSLLQDLTDDQSPSIDDLPVHLAPIQPLSPIRKSPLDTLSRTPLMLSDKADEVTNEILDDPKHLPYGPSDSLTVSQAYEGGEATTIFKIYSSSELTMSHEDQEQSPQTLRSNNSLNYSPAAESISPMLMNSPSVWADERDRRKIELELNVRNMAGMKEDFNVDEEEVYTHREDITQSPLQLMFLREFGNAKTTATKHELWARLVPSCCFNEAEKVAMEHQGSEVQVTAGQTIIQNGHEIDTLYLLLRGSIEYVGYRSNVGPATCIFEPLVMPTVFCGSPKTAPCDVVAETECCLWKVNLNDYTDICCQSIARVRMEVARILIADPAFSGLELAELEAITHYLVPTILSEPMQMEAHAFYVVWQGLMVATDLSNDRREQYYESDVFSRNDLEGVIEMSPRQQPTVLFSITEEKIKLVTGLTFDEIKERRRDRLTNDMVNLDSISVIADNKKRKKKTGISGVMSSTAKFLGVKRKHPSSRSAVGITRGGP